MNTSKNRQRLSAEKTLDMLEYLSNGCVYAPTCDPDLRNHSKRVSMQCRANHTINDANIKLVWYQLIQVTHKLQKELSDNERENVTA